MNKKIISMLFLSICTLSLQTRCVDIEKFAKKHPFAYANIKTIAGFIFKDMFLQLDLKNKNAFQQGPQQEKELIRSLAKKIGFSEKGIDSIEVKTPVRGTIYDTMLKNNHAAYRNTILLGRYSNKTLRNLIENDNNVKKFIYAHELSHIKHWHRAKRILSLNSCPLLVHYGFKYFNVAAKHIIPKICGEKLSPYLSIFLSEFKTITNFVPIKLGVQAILALFLNRKREHTADMGAASLGSDVIKGGIKFFKSLDSHEMGTSKNRILRKILGIFRTHPYSSERVAYLKKELERQINY